MTRTYDLVAIGGGTAGLSAVQAAAALGKRALLVTDGQIGGECTWNGCVPSKALIAAARVRHTVTHAQGFGISVDGASVDFAAVMRRVHTVIERIAGYEDEAHLRQAGIDVLMGRGRLGGDGTVTVEGEAIRARRIVVATGSVPSIPSIPGLASTPYLTNQTVFALTSQPGRLLVLGAGPVGVELAQAFARLGTTVDVVDTAGTYLPQEEPDIAEESRRLLERDGVRFTLGSTPAAVSYDGATFTLELTEDAATRTLRGDALLVATGRTPEVAGLGLSAAGVRTTSAGIAVDSHLRTSAPGVYAAGDVTGVLPFTHVAAYQGRLAARNALGKRLVASYRVIPWVIFTDPEIAHVGLTERQAREQHGDDVHVATLPFTAIDRAVITGETDGVIKVVTKGKPLLGHAGGGELLGAHIIGAGAGELIHEFVLAMQVRAFSGRLAQAIHAYPAMAVGVQQAAAQLFAAGRATAGEMREGIASDGA